MLQWVSISAGHFRCDGAFSLKVVSLVNILSSSSRHFSAAEVPVVIVSGRDYSPVLEVLQQ